MTTTTTTTRKKKRKKFSLFYLQRKMIKNPWGGNEIKELGGLSFLEMKMGGNK